MSKQSRTYNGIAYAQCKSTNDLLAAMRREIEKGEHMEYELMRRGDTEPRDMQDYPIQNVKEEMK